MTFDNPLSDAVAQTLYITLYMKAQEQNVAAPLLVDPWAARLCQAINFNFSQYNAAPMSRLGVVVRARYFDDCALKFIEAKPKPVLVFLGCGLDARSERLQSQITAQKRNQCQFVELDLPEVMAFRERLLPIAPNTTRMSASILDMAWAQQLQQQFDESHDFLLILEGVSMYLSRAQMYDFMRLSAKHFARLEIYMDVINTWMAARSKIHDSVRKSGAHFDFGCDDAREFCQLDARFKLVDSQYIQQLYGWQRLNMMLRILMQLHPKARTATMMLHYKIS